MYNVISMFSGCGGMDLGFVRKFKYCGLEFPSLPYRVIWANDYDRCAVEVYNHNFKTDFEPSDVKTVRFDEVDTGGEKIDVLIAGFPCQEFSLSGPRNGLSSDRGQLYLEIRRALDTFKPKVFMAENVPGIEHPPIILKTIMEALSSGGTAKYEISVFHINAADYGVPQIRRRVILIGIRSDIEAQFTPPAPTHRAPFVTESGSSLPSWIKSVAEKGPNLPNELPTWPTAKEAIDDLWDPVGTNGSSVSDQNKRTRATIILNRPKRRDRRLSADLPSPTIRAQHHGHIEVHYGDQDDGSLRRLTIRECARLQGFPDTFEFPVSASQAYVQIGNAMPPVVVHQWAHAIAEWLEGIDDG